MRHFSINTIEEGVLCVVNKCRVIEFVPQVSFEEQIETRKQEIIELRRKAFPEMNGEDEKEKDKKIKAKFREAYKNKCNEFLQWIDEEEIASRTAKRFCYVMITNYFIDARQFENALYTAEYALKYSEGIEISKVYHLIGICYKWLENRTKALRYLNKSLSEYESQGLYFEMAQIFDIKGDMLSSESMFKKAEKYYEMAKNTTSANDNLYNYNKCKNRVYKRLLRLYIKNGEQNFMKCYKLYNKIQDAALKKEAKEMIAEAYGKEV
jgi:tetratricopeptide (TPR) repeat protein